MDNLQCHCPICQMPKDPQSRYCPECGHPAESSLGSAISVLQNQSGLCQACEITGCGCRQNPFFSRLKGLLTPRDKF